MKVFELISDTNVRAFTRIKGLERGVNIFRKEAVYGEIGQRSLEILVDYMEGHPPIISGELKSLLERFDSGLYTKRIQLKYTNKDMARKRYWYAQPRMLNALHEKSTLNRSGHVEEPVFREREVRYATIFSVLGLRKEQWFVSRTVAESMLRNKFLGVSFREVEVLE